MPMTARQFREHVEELGMTIRSARYLTGVSERTVRRFAVGEDIPLVVELLLRLMVKLKLTPDKVFELTGMKVPREARDGWGDRRELGQ